LSKPKKIISIVIKTLIGVLSFWIIYWRLKSDFTETNLTLLSQSVFSASGIVSVLLCLLLIPVNWGIESYKWQLITSPLEKISFKNAQKSVYSGLCLGNLAPGRATEFLGKIIFFAAKNRPQITVMHFVNGMFQLSITFVVGFIALTFKINSFGEEYLWVAYVCMCTATLVLGIFVFSIIKIDKVLHFVSNKISKQKNIEHFEYKFSKATLIKLFSFSFIRYLVFFLQMALLINLFSGTFNSNIALGMALYFLITTAIPMISVIEAAIRAAVALIVFKGCGISDTALALASVNVWIINIIIPSIIGYYFLLKQNFDFKLISAKK